MLAGKKAVTLCRVGRRRSGLLGKRSALLQNHSIEQRPSPSPLHRQREIIRNTVRHYTLSMGSSTLTKIEGKTPRADCGVNSGR